ncbi:Hypothetical protein A7982_11856 [Minicystis rosea]|nr:Hypothetical protein A7982_11856 [Minicystis rosea]
MLATHLSRRRAFVHHPFMPSIVTFDSTIAARTRAADRILATADMLAAYEAKGGLAEDLQQISAAGHQAEVLSQVRSAAQAAGGAATLAVLTDFVGLQKEYSAIMAVVSAALHDLAAAGAPAEVIKGVERILVNEAEIMIRTVTSADGKGGKPKKAAVKRASQEALRAEIARDARALQSLAVIHPVLQKRKVDAPRLDKLLASAEALAGKLADRAAAKGDGKQATSAMHEAVTAQKKKWAACYRLLAALGREDARVAQLLGDAVPKRSKKG